jgi:PAS domain S-box-containing protein
MMGSDEAARLEAVRQYAAGDFSQEATFDRTVTLAADLLSTPVALFSVVDVDRIWFKARYGLQIDHVDREPGFCANAILQDKPWVIEDARAASDARENRLVKEFGLASYAGVPLAVKDGHKLGTLCVLDRLPRAFCVRELGILESLASLIVDGLELRRAAREAAEAASVAARDRELALRTANRLVNDGRLLAALVESSQDAIVSKNLNGIVTSWNPAAEETFGYSAAEMIGKSITRIIPDDRLDEETFVLGSIRRGERIEHFETIRRRSDGRLIPISLTVSPIKDENGTILGASKIARNISDRVESQNRIHALLREVNHRVKNQFAVILSMIRQTNGRTHDPQQFETKIRQRIMALARSHDLLVSRNWDGAPIQDVLKAQTESFGHPDRIAASGPELLLSPMAVQYLGMAFHELFRNAIDHGSLSAEAGTVEVDWDIVDRNDEEWLALTWRESGGPANAVVKEGGLGKIMVERITPAAIGGVGRFIEEHDGVRWELQAPLRQLEPRDLAKD